MEKYILSLDQGTTNSRAIIFNKNGIIISIAYREFKQFYPNHYWVEHNPKEIWYSQSLVASEAMSKANLVSKNIAAIGITNQRETTLIWDRYTSEPIYNAIVWQDKRTANYCDFLKKEGFSHEIKKKTGLVIDSYFSATKIRWILNNIPNARKKAEQGLLAFGTIDSWIIWNLTGRKKHITDITNASRTMLYNINILDWDDELLKLFEIPRSLLPIVKSCSEIFGYTDSCIFSNSIPISGVAGDQQAALFGQMCTNIGMVKNTYGTGCFLLMNIGDKPIISSNNLITTIAWKIKEKIQYALEGSVFMTGAVIKWLKDGLRIISDYSDSENFAASDSNDLYFVPAFSGLGAPYWDQHAKGILVGITQRTNSSHIIRASLESIAFQNMDVLKAMEADSNISIKELRVDGGASKNNLLMQFQADILNVKVIRSEVMELTAAGSAYLAGLAINYWNDIEEIKKNWKINYIFEPKYTHDRINRIKNWKKAVKISQAWTKI